MKEKAEAQAAKKKAEEELEELKKKNPTPEELQNTKDALDKANNDLAEERVRVIELEKVIIKLEGDLDRFKANHALEMALVKAAEAQLFADNAKKAADAAAEIANKEGAKEAVKTAAVEAKTAADAAQTAADNAKANADEAKKAVDAIQSEELTAAEAAQKAMTEADKAEDNRVIARDEATKAQGAFDATRNQAFKEELNEALAAKKQADKAKAAAEGTKAESDKKLENALEEKEAAEKKLEELEKEKSGAEAQGKADEARRYAEKAKGHAAAADDAAKAAQTAADAVKAGGENAAQAGKDLDGAVETAKTEAAAAKAAADEARKKADEAREAAGEVELTEDEKNLETATDAAERAARDAKYARKDAGDARKAANAAKTLAEANPNDETLKKHADDADKAATAAETNATQAEANAKLTADHAEKAKAGGEEGRRAAAAAEESAKATAGNADSAYDNADTAKEAAFDALEYALGLAKAAKEKAESDADEASDKIAELEKEKETSGKDLEDAKKAIELLTAEVKKLTDEKNLGDARRAAEEARKQAGEAAKAAEQAAKSATSAEAAAETAKKKLEADPNNTDLQTKANAAKAAAEASRTAATAAKNEADEADKDATAAENQVSQAEKGEIPLKDAADEAKKKAGEAKVHADEAKRQAELAKTKADEALENIDRGDEEAAIDNAQAEADRAKAAANNAAANLEKTKTHATAAETAAKQAKEIADKTPTDADARQKANQASEAAEKAKAEVTKAEAASNRAAEVAEDAQAAADRAKLPGSNPTLEAKTAELAADLAEAKERDSKANEIEADRLARLAEGLVDPRTPEEKQRAAEAEGYAKQAQTAADNAKIHADNAKRSADLADQHAKGAAEEAAKRPNDVAAQKLAEASKAKADLAKAEADRAKKAADDAQTQADGAKENAANAGKAGPEGIEAAGAARANLEKARGHEADARDAAGKADQYEKDAKVSFETITDPERDVTPPDAPIKLKFLLNGALTGEGEPKATVTIRNAAGEIVGTTTVGDDGKFTTKLTGKLAVGDKFSVTLTDDAFNTSEPSEVIFTGLDDEGKTIDVTPPDAPTDVKVDDKGVVTGKGEAGTLVKIYNADGQEIAEGIVDQNRNIQATIPLRELNGQCVKVVLFDSALNESQPAIVPVPNLTPVVEPDAILAAPQILSVGANGEVKGKTAANTYVQFKNAEGMVIATGTSDSRGDFTIQLPKSVQNGQELAAEAVNKDGVPSDQAKFKANIWVPDGQSTEDQYGNDIYSSGDFLENRVNTTTSRDQSKGRATGLADGGWVVTWQSATSSNGIDIYQQRYDKRGNKVGSETRVNSKLSDGQENPSITALADGGWIVTWQSWGQNGSSSYDIVQQRYDKSGARVGKEVTVNEYLPDYQHMPEIAALPDGGWVVIFQSWNVTTSQDIFVQRYNAKGEPQYKSLKPGFGGEVQVNAYSTDLQERPKVAALEDGGWIATFRYKNPSTGTFEIIQQRFNEDGDRVGYENQVSTTAKGNKDNPSVTGLADGGWIIGWETTQYGDNNRVILTQRYDKNGNRVGGEKRTAGSITDDTQVVIKALPTGGYVVSWTSSSADASGKGVKMQIFDRAGNAVGDEITVNTGTYDDQYGSSIAVLADGGFVITWDSKGQDGDGLGVYQQRFDKNGQRWEPTANEQRAGDQNEPSVAYLTGGGYVVTWTSTDRDGSGKAVVMQRFDQNGKKLGNETIVNTVTQGDQEKSQVVGLADGGFLVVWSGPGTGKDLYAARYDKNGVKIRLDGTALAGDGDTIINSVTTGDQNNPTVTALKNGGWIIAWESGYVQTNGRTPAIITQMYDSNGKPVGPIQRVAHDLAEGEQTKPSIAALDDGGYVLVWQTSNGKSLGDNDGLAIVMVRYTADGNRMPGSEVLVNTTTNAWQNSPKVVSLGPDGYVVTWIGSEADGNRPLYFQRYGLDGKPQGGETKVNDSTSEFYVLNPVITSLPDGSFVIAWSAGEDGTTIAGVFQRKFDKNGQPLGGVSKVNNVAPLDQLEPTITSLGDGTWVVAYKHQTTKTSKFPGYIFGIGAKSWGANDTDIHHRRFGTKKDGTAVELPMDATAEDVEAILNDQPADNLQPVVQSASASVADAEQDVTVDAKEEDVSTETVQSVQSEAVAVEVDEELDVISLEGLSEESSEQTEADNDSGEEVETEVSDEASGLEELVALSDETEEEIDLSDVDFGTEPQAPATTEEETTEVAASDFGAEDPIAHIEIQKPEDELNNSYAA